MSNANCPSSKPNIKYIQYDKDNMKYIKVCMDCYQMVMKSYLVKEKINKIKT